MGGRRERECGSGRRGGGRPTIDDRDKKRVGANSSHNITTGGSDNRGDAIVGGRG